jgi:hypothetical protein
VWVLVLTSFSTRTQLFQTRGWKQQVFPKQLSNLHGVKTQGLFYIYSSVYAVLFMLSYVRCSCFNCKACLRVLKFFLSRLEVTHFFF